MHIKKLEIGGFKSFVEKTVIHFDHDVIGIVGPNGCGKSNIVDAIRWCMGEQSAKHLRGRAMEDVIFNGSDSRAAAGLAEVTLTFDNADPSYAESLPIEYRDYPEIAITRRLFRDGTSEYLINKTQVRLRDITELFLGTGVGTKAYSIVEQGRIGQIVSARPEDRRLFIEEAAGVTKYKQRRKQAERKMELTRQNLARVSDIVREIERSSATLERQVQKAERYKAARTELEDLVLYDASFQLLELTVVERVHQSGLGEHGGTLEAVRTDLAKEEEGLGQIRQESLEIESRAEQASKRAFAADNEVSALQAENQRAKDRVVHLEQRLTDALREHEEVVSRASDVTREHGEHLAQLEALARDEAARKADAAAEDEALGALQREEKARTAALDGARREFGGLQTQTAAATARLDGIVRRRNDAQVRSDALTAERETTEAELGTLSARKAALETAVQEALEGKGLTAGERANLEQELPVLRGRVHEAEKELDTVKNEVGLKRNRLRVLEDLHRRLEGVGAGARALLSKGDSAVLGLVADRIEAPAELTEAFAALLGERLQYVVVTDAERGLALLDDLKRTGRARGHVIVAQPPHVAGARSSELAPGIAGYLRDSLRYSTTDAALVAALVGDALLAETAAAALSYIEAGGTSVVVARDGTVVRPDGVISGGSGDGVAAAMLEQKREMHVLGDEISVLSSRQEAKVQALAACRTRLTELETALEQARQAAHQGELAHVTAQKDLVRTESDIARVRRRVEAIGAELLAVSKAQEETSLAETQTAAQMVELEGAVQAAEAAVQSAQEEANVWRERVAAQAALLTERRVRLAQVAEQSGAARAAVQRIESQLEDLRARGRRLEDDAETTAGQIGETAAHIYACRESRIRAASASIEAHGELEVARVALESVRRLLGEREGALRELRVRQAELDEVVRGHELALQRIHLGLEHLLGGIRDKFRGLDLRRVVGDYHKRPLPDATTKDRIDELNKMIDRMGPVNLDAAREFEEARSRYESLSAQKKDIEVALIELEKAIKHMDKESKNRFRDTFNAVNELFKKSFTKNFRGGRAELRLTDPEDLLNSGVDIIAQPPGKKLGNIELMSGGEKALTAVSLIFAIFQHRPAPFCVLDEVDAPLDEANVSRYNEAIRTMTTHSQFILITHVRKTMQSVDVLYGVTMGEPGVSRLVSVKVNDEARARSEAVQERVA